MSGTVQKLARPNVSFRNPAIRYITRWSYGVGALSVVLAGAYYYHYKTYLRDLYDNYDKKFDKKEEFERLKRMGFYQSVNPDGSVGNEGEWN